MGMCFFNCAPATPDVGPPPTPVPQLTHLGELGGPWLKGPTRIAVAPSGDIVVTDARARAVHVLHAGGRYRFKLDRVGDPLGCAVGPDGRIYVGDVFHKTVRVYDPLGNYLSDLAAGFLMPSDLVVDQANNVVYVTDSRLHQVRGFSAAGAQVYAFGGYGTSSGQLNFPTGLAIEPTVGTLYVVDHLNSRMQVFSRQGAFVAAFGAFARAQGVAIDSLERLYIADAFQGRVQVVDHLGRHVTYLGTAGTTPGRMLLPLDAVVDGYHRLLVASHGTGKILVYGIDSYTLPPPEVVAATVVIEPRVLNLASHGQAVKVTVEVPSRSAVDIDPASARLVVAATSIPADRALPPGDDDGDGVTDVVFRFLRSALVAALPPDRTVRVGFTGQLLTGELVEGFADLTLKLDGGQP